MNFWEGRSERFIAEELRVSRSTIYVLKKRILRKLARQLKGVSMQNVIRFSVDKIVAQRAYPVEIRVDLKKGIAVIEGDRITSIQGLKAAGDLRLELGFESGPRTEQNPWGVYVSKEKEFQ
ncbi:MAG: hypothetical protein AB7K68_15525 [Bacteriovoracia bacterium]